MFAPFAMCNTACRADRIRSMGDDEDLTKIMDQYKAEEVVPGQRGAPMPGRARAPDEELPAGISLAAAAALCGEEQAEGSGMVDHLLREVSQGNMEAVTQMLSGGLDANVSNATDETPLHVAAYHGRLDMVNLLLAHGAHTEVVDGKGKTPLRRAYDNEDIAGALLEAGANPNVSDLSGGGTTLHRAAEGGFSAVVQLLLRHGAHPNRSNEEGETALHEASIYGQADCVQLLLAGKADPIATDHAGNTPLHCCAYSDDLASSEVVAKLLMDAGADPYILNTDEETYWSLHKKRADRQY
eukprot:TRINITY_DN41925_c0_g1_i1.p1 TRINITY_DN41925_c0_g1~~TRINITY_DN41925_c0_g1_i1.p1  ORF type:complete len:298 (+),score=58.65 TRINITY_DN41925_c0_g1_i1:127-1020(+)